jgi:hypothetical protein
VSLAALSGHLHPAAVLSLTAAPCCSLLPLPAITARRVLVTLSPSLLPFPPPHKPASTAPSRMHPPREHCRQAGAHTSRSTRDSSLSLAGRRSCAAVSRPQDAATGATFIELAPRRAEPERCSATLTGHRLHAGLRRAVTSPRRRASRRSSPCLIALLPRRRSAKPSRRPLASVDQP